MDRTLAEEASHQFLEVGLKLVLTLIHLDTGESYISLDITGRWDQTL